MALFSRVKVWVTGEVLTAADLNGEFDNILNNFIPTSMVGYSANVSQMQTVADPGDPGTESLATNIAGEITRLRFMIQNITKGAQWYASDLEAWITASMIAVDADFSVFIPDGSITADMLGDFSLPLDKLPNANMTRNSGSVFVSQSTSGALIPIPNLTDTITVDGGRPIIADLSANPTAGSTTALTYMQAVTTSTSSLTTGMNISYSLVREFPYVNMAVKFFTIQASNTDVTTIIQAGTATTIFPTGTSNYGILLQGADQFDRVNFSISQAQTGTPVYTYEYWNGTTWSALAVGTIPDFSTTGIKQMLFTIPGDWVVGSDVGSADPTKYSIRILATTAPLTAVQATAIEIDPKWQILTSVGGTITDVTSIVEAGTAINLFTTTNNDGIIIQGDDTFSGFQFFISQAQTGSPVYVYEYWNGSAWASIVPGTETGATNPFGATGVITFTSQPPAGWVVGSNLLGPDPGMYSIRIRASTAPTQAVKATSVVIEDYYSITQISTVQPDFNGSVVNFGQPSLIIPISARMVTLAAKKGTHNYKTFVSSSNAGNTVTLTVASAALFAYEVR